MIRWTYSICLICISWLSLAQNGVEQIESEKKGQHFVVVPPPNITVNMPEVNIKLNNENSSSSNSASTSQSQSSAQANSINTVTSSTTVTLINEIVSTIKTVQKSAQDIPKQLHMWFLENKWNVILGCTVALYGYIWYRLLSLSYYLSNPNAWHSYKEQLTFNELLSIQQDEFAQDIIRTIQRKYAPQSAQDFFTPFTLFSKDIDQEAEWLHQIITIYSRLKTLRATKLFPWKNPCLELAQEKLQRVLYIRTTAFSWLGAFKLEKYTQLAPEFIFTKKIMPFGGQYTLRASQQYPLIQTLNQ